MEKLDRDTSLTSSYFSKDISYTNDKETNMKEISLHGSKFVYDIPLVDLRLTRPPDSLKQLSLNPVDVDEIAWYRHAIVDPTNNHSPVRMAKSGADRLHLTKSESKFSRSESARNMIRGSPKSISTSFGNLSDGNRNVLSRSISVLESRNKRHEELEEVGSSRNSKGQFSNENNSHNHTTTGPSSIAIQERSKRMNAMIKNFCYNDTGFMKEEIDLKQYNIDSGEIVSNAVIQELCVVNQVLTKLNLTDCSEVSDVGLWAIARHCIGIKSLILSGCHQITHIGVRSLSLRLLDLVELDMSYCRNLDDIALTVVASGCWHLEVSGKVVGR